VSAGLFDAPVLDCYKDDPKSIGAAVQRACITHGLFDGKKAQRSSVLTDAQYYHREANGGVTWPEHETLGRELRHRKERMVNGENRQRMHFADRALAQGWRIVCEKGRVWANRI
jgi:hypothetical protein